MENIMRTILVPACLVIIALVTGLASAALPSPDLAINQQSMMAKTNSFVSSYEPSINVNAVDMGSCGFRE
jgi:hypothetical protein